MTAPHIQQKTGKSLCSRTFDVLAGVGITLVFTTGSALAGNDDDTNYKHVPVTIESRLYGIIKKIPTKRLGTWIVNSREITVTRSTKITEEYGKAVKGAYIEVEGTNAGKIFTASKIEVKRASP